MTKKEERILREIKDKYVAAYFKNRESEYERGRAEVAVTMYNKLAYPVAEETELEPDEETELEPDEY